MQHPFRKKVVAYLVFFSQIKDALGKAEISMKEFLQIAEGKSYHTVIIGAFSAAN